MKKEIIPEMSVTNNKKIKIFEEGIPIKSWIAIAAPVLVLFIA